LQHMMKRFRNKDVKFLSCYTLPKLTRIVFEQYQLF